MCNQPRSVKIFLVSIACSLMVACGGGGGDTLSAPSGLAYTSPTVATVGSAATHLNPTVTGTVSSYTVAPSLPAGITLDGGTGVISGTPMAAAGQTTYTITASNSAGSTTFALVLTVNPAATKSLSYPSPSVAVVGTPFSLSPTVAGTATSYAVTPALPAGLALNTSTGVISGTPTAPVPAATYSVTASDATGSAPSFPLSLAVQIAAPSGLTYSGASIATVGVAYVSNPSVTGSVSSYSVSPSLPSGLALNTSTGIISGTPSSTASQSTYVITAANVSGSTGFTLNLTVNPSPPSNLSYGSNIAPLLVQKPVTLTPSATGLVTSFAAPSGLPNGLTINPTTGVISGTPTAAASLSSYTVTATNVSGSTTATVLLEVDAGPTMLLTGAASVNNSNPISYFWKATDGQLFDLTGKPLTSAPTGAQVLWKLPQGPGLHFAYLLATDGQGNCAESRLVVDTDVLGAPTPISSATTMPAAGPIYAISCSNIIDVFMGAGPPATTATGQVQITSMSASYNGSTSYNGSIFAALQQVLPVVQPVEPSSAYTQSNSFLTYQGQNDVFDACNYYANILVATCNGTGKLTSAETFAGWKATSKIDTAANSIPATYFVNVEDLTLTREHHSVTYTDTAGNTAIAAYVCNHLGPNSTGTPFGTPVFVNPTTVWDYVLQTSQGGNASPQQNAINTAVTNAMANQNLIACVAMDYVTLADQTRITRFMVFGPSGELLPSVNLDGRGEKYVPGVCIACHGGVANPPSNGNTNAFFLPYDMGNFAFSTANSSLSPVSGACTNAPSGGIACQIQALNQNIVAPNSTPCPAPYNTSPYSATLSMGATTCATSNLVQQWYSGNTGFNYTYTPTSWSSNAATYGDVVARSCRTCHTAIPSYDWDLFGPGSAGPPAQVGFGSSPYNLYVCSQPATSRFVMPNSGATLDRFWLSHSNPQALALQNGSSPKDQVVEYQALVQAVQALSQPPNCVLP